MSTSLFATPTPVTIAVVVLIGMLLFGNRLPEMGRVLAKSIRAFKETMSGIEDEVTGAVGRAGDPTMNPRLPQRVSAPLPPLPCANERNGVAPEPPNA
jgi:sec-independent protein translocase protein TatA